MAISGLLRRMGFVKLDDFGLILTPEGRVLSTRTHVLDDGFGGKIVGWRETDLAATELQRWEPALPPTRRIGRAKVITKHPPLPGLAPITIASPTVPTVTPVATSAFTAPTSSPSVRPISAPAPSPVAVPAAQMSPKVDPEPVEEEDEWEWEIAMARARAAAEWAEEAATAAPALATRPVARSKRATSPIAIVAEPRRTDPLQTDNWPKTEPLIESWDSTSQVVRVLPRAPSPTPPRPIVIATPAPRELALRAPAPTPAAAAPTARPMGTIGTIGPMGTPGTMGTMGTPGTPGTPPASSPVARSAPRPTVIPVPALPSAIDPKSIVPRMRSTTGMLPRPPSSVMAPPRRVPRSTDPVGEDTLVSGTAAPANDDATTPGLILPPASMGKRVAAKQR